MSLGLNALQCKRSAIQCLKIATRSCAATAPQRSSNTQPGRASAPRRIHTTQRTLQQSRPPKSRDRGPKSNEDTQTDFAALDVLRNTIAPATSIDACTSDGFALNNQMRISSSGILLIGGEAFRWWPWRQDGTVPTDESDAMTGKLLNAKGQLDVHMGAWGVLELVYPKPGTSPSGKLRREC